MHTARGSQQPRRKPSSSAGLQLIVLDLAVSNGVGPFRRHAATPGRGTIPAVDRLLEATYRAESEHFWFRGFRAFIAPLLEAATAGTARPRILDAGCGTGVNLGVLDRLGEVYGFDLNRTGLAFAVQRGHRRIARATMASIPFPDAAFDLVTSFDVLYALPDEVERAGVREMARVLRPGGFLVVNVAAMDILKGGHGVLAEEVRRYSRRSLRQLLEDEGFEIQRLTYTNATLFPLVLAVRLLQRLTGVRSADRAGLEISIPAAPVNTLLTAALTTEAWLTRRVSMPFGSSLLCLARKRADRP